jgi:hypothetical protein
LDPGRAFWPAGWQAIADRYPSVPFSNSISPIDNKIAKPSGNASNEVDTRSIEEGNGTCEEEAEVGRKDETEVGGRAEDFEE